MLAIEKKRHAAGYKEEDYFIENYDLNAFLKGTADNITLSPQDLREIYEIKLDWVQKKLWVWEKKGISCWSLKTGKRVNFYKDATGPIAFHAKTRLLAYQIRNDIVIENTDSGKTIYRATLGRFDRFRPEKILNIFSPDGTLFAYVDHNSLTRTSDLKVVNTSDGLLKIIKPMEGGSFRFYGVSEKGGRVGNPLLFMLNNNYLLARVNIGSEQYCDDSSLMILPLNELEKIRRFPTDLCAIALFIKNDHLYIDMGDKKPINVFKVQNIIAAKETLPPPDAMIMVGDADIRYTNRLLVSDTFILRADFSYLGYLPLSGPKQGQTRIIGSYRFDADMDADLFAVADWRGFVIIKKISALQEQNH